MTDAPDPKFLALFVATTEAVVLRLEESANRAPLPEVIRFATQTTQNNPIQIRERPKPARKPKGGKR